jgi:hypothetical protein
VHGSIGEPWQITTCQEVYFICPGKGSDPSPQIFQKSERLATPNWFNVTIPKAKKAKTINGDIQLAAFETVSYPFEAINEIRAPMRITIITQVIPLGMVSVNLGIGISAGIPTALADTVIIDPAKKTK